MTHKLFLTCIQPYRLHRGNKTKVKTVSPFFINIIQRERERERERMKLYLLMIFTITVTLIMNVCVHFKPLQNKAFFVLFLSLVAISVMSLIC